MEPEVFIEIFRYAMTQIILLVSAVIVPSLCIGLVVAIFQAATSINEQTLSFLPRLLVTIGAMMFGGHWMINKLMEFFVSMVDMIPKVVG